LTELTLDASKFTVEEGVVVWRVVFL